jgi:hypothetical protein
VIAALPQTAGIGRIGHGSERERAEVIMAREAGAGLPRGVGRTGIEPVTLGLKVPLERSAVAHKAAVKEDLLTLRPYTDVEQSLSIFRRTAMQHLKEVMSNA